MDKIISENLFLLEFLVDKVNLTPGAVPREISDVAGETCVSFKFLDNDPLDICEADFTPQRDYNHDSGNMKNGKSCLFAISPQQVNDAMKKFDVEVAIFKKLTNGCLPDKLQIGHSVVPISFMFNEILQLVQQKAEAGTVSRTLKETFPISGQSCGNIGAIGVFIRMSCFGKLIVTQFQMNLEEKSVFFKDKEGRSLYKYRKASRQEASGNLSSRDQGSGGMCMSGGGQSGGYEPERSGGYGNSAENQSNCCTKPSPGCGLPCYGPSELYTQHGGMINKQTITSIPEQDSCPCNKWNDAPPVKPLQYPSTDYSSTYDSSTCKDCNDPPALTPAYPQAQMCPPPPCPFTSPPPTYPPKGCYQEIGAEMNGNALTIRVHKNKGLSVRKVDDDGSDMPSEACGCAAPSRPAKNGGFGYVGEGTAYMADPCRSPALPPCAEKQILSLKPADDGNNPFTFKMSGCGNQARENITVVPPTSTRPDGMQVTEISDPNKDVFILRIGKKSEGTDKKANLELELVTPKGPDKKPIPKKETRDTQYLESDVPKPTAAKKPKPKPKGKKKK